MLLVLASSIAITVENNLKHNSAFKKKKHDKRGLDDLTYGLQEGAYQEQVYGPPVPPAPVYEIPAPDATHPIHIPEPLPPIGHPVGL